MPSLFTRTKRCRHIHYSGRRCAGRYSGADSTFCRDHRPGTGYHRDTACSECQAMLRAFPLRKDVDSASGGNPQ